MEQQKIAEIKEKLKEEKYRFVQKSLDCLSSILNIYRSPIYISFNGGKDATVVLHLLMIYLNTSPTISPTQKHQKVRAIYLIEPDSFQEVDQFIQQMVAVYGFELIKLEKNYERMKEYMEEQKIESIIMGTRRSDPYSGSLLAYCPSDPEYGRFMRILPILDWNYQQIWQFLLGLGLQYCPLYQQGYTYLGNKNNTTKNPTLELEDGSYQHAQYCEDIDEHFSRSQQQTKTQGQGQKVKVMVVMKYINNYRYGLIVEKVNRIVDSGISNLVMISEQDQLELKGEWIVFIEDCIYEGLQQQYDGAIRLVV